MTRYLTALVSVLLLLMASGCSFPKIIVLHDPLSADEHIRLGSIYESQGKTALARDQYRAATRLEKTNIKAWMLSGDLSYQMGDYADAEAEYSKALDLDPKNADLYNNIALVEVHREKDLQDALNRVETAITLKPAHRPYYLDTLGYILLKLGRTSEAVSALQESVATIPPDQPNLLAEAYDHLADAYEAAGDADRARDARKKRQQLKSNP